MLTSLARVNAIHEALVTVIGLTGLFAVESPCENGCDLPTRTSTLLREALFGVLAKEQLDELFKGVGLHLLTILGHLHILSRERREFHTARVKHRLHVI